MTESIHNITRAICRQADGSRADGKKMVQLPFAVMGFDVNLAAIGHSEVASDTDRLTARLFLTDYCEALSNAIESNMNFHFVMNKCCLRALGGSCSTSSTNFQKNRVLISREIKYSVVSSIESLPSLNYNSHSMCKCTNKFD